MTYQEFLIWLLGIIEETESRSDWFLNDIGMMLDDNSEHFKKMVQTAKSVSDSNP